MVERLAEDQGDGAVGRRPGGRRDGRRDRVHLSQRHYPDGAASIRDGHRRVHVSGRIECLDCRGAPQRGGGVVLCSLDRDGACGVDHCGVDHRDAVGCGDDRVGAAVHHEGVHRRRAPEGGMHAAVGDHSHRDGACGVGYIHHLKAVVRSHQRPDFGSQVQRHHVPGPVEVHRGIIGETGHRDGVGGMGQVEDQQAVVRS